MRRKSGRGTDMDRLVAVVARLRAPGGCPWDRKQTHRSLIKYLREEARELEEALLKGDGDEVEDELGDVLLQVLLHAQIASEHGRFDIQDVARSQHLKLRRRHPHVFGKRRFRTAAEVLRNWDTIKTAERKLRQRDLKRRRRAKGLAAAAFLALASLSGTASRAQGLAAPTRLAPHLALFQTNGSFATPLPGVETGFDGTVNALGVDPEGRIVAVGEFNSFNGRDGLNGIARLLPDGTIDDRFCRIAGKPLSELGRYDTVAFQPNGDILVGGFFTSYGGHPANGLIRLHPNGGMNPEFIRKTELLAVGESGIRGRSIALSRSGRIVLGGDFAHRAAILRLYPNGIQDTEFRPPLDLIRMTGSHNDDPVRVALDARGRILLAGSLQIGGPETVGRLVRLNVGGSLDRTFEMAVFKGNGNSIEALVLQPDGKILVGGSFNEAEGTPAPNLVRLNPDGTPDPGFLYSLGEGFGKTPDKKIRALLLEKGGGIIVGGDFGLGRLLPGGRVDEAFSRRYGSGVDGPVTALAWTSNGRILAGGAFSAVADPKSSFPAWNKCSADVQCLPVPGPCGDWDVVTTGFAGEIEAYNRRRRLAENCVVQETPRPEAVCASGVCAAKP